MKPVIIIAGGGHARVVLDLLLQLGREVKAFVDPSPSFSNKSILGIPVIGSDSEAFKFSPNEIEFANGLGTQFSTEKRRNIFLAYKSRGYLFPVFIHPSAYVSPNAALGEGTLVMAGSVVQAHSRVGMNCIINTRSSIDHDVVIGDHCHIAPGATICGTVQIGEGVHVGAASCIIENLSIASDAYVCAGAVVTKNVSLGQKVMGVPAK